MGRCRRPLTAAAKGCGFFAQPGSQPEKGSKGAHDFCFSDLPAQPTLARIDTGVVIQPTKHDSDNSSQLLMQSHQRWETYWSGPPVQVQGAGRHDGLSNFDQVSIRVAHVAPQFRCVDLWFGNKCRASRGPKVVAASDVGRAFDTFSVGMGRLHKPEM
jgi:hypothetical protein